MVWTTAVINGNMNFADTLYWLQIATTSASNHSSHNSLFSRSAKLDFFLHSHLLYPILIITRIQNFPRFSHYFSITGNDSPSPEMRSTAPTYYIMEKPLWDERSVLKITGKRSGSVSAEFGVIGLNNYCQCELSYSWGEMTNISSIINIAVDSSCPLGVGSLCFQELQMLPPVFLRGSCILIHNCKSPI